MRKWCQKAISVATRSLAVIMATLIWVSVSGGALAQPVITDVDGYSHGGVEYVAYNGFGSVTITGSGFTGATAVHFGGVPTVGFINVINDTRIDTFAPAGTFGTSVSVTVTTPSGTSAPSSTLLVYGNYYQSGVVSVTPAEGPATGGTPVTITGSEFTGASKVEFGTILATSFVVVNNTTITAVAPAGTGTVDIFVTPPQGDANCACGGAAARFTYIQAPQVTKLVRNGGSTAGGDTVILTGTDFTAATAVTFGATAAMGFTVDSATQITAISPAGTGNVNVTVTTLGGTSATAAGNLFYYGSPQPLLTAATPSSGPEAGGTSVTITGSGFNGSSEVLFGTIPAASFTVDSDTQITAISPPGTGAVSLFVDAPCCTNAASGTFTYIPPGPPADSLKVEIVQQQLTSVVARQSGGAISGAIARGIAQGLSGEPAANVGSESAFVAYSPSLANSGPFAGIGGGAGDPDGISLWLDVQGSGLLSGGSGGQLNVTGGLGQRFSDEFVAGVIGGQEWFSYSSAAPVGLLTGNGLSAGGYTGWRFSENGLLDAAVVLTALGYDVSAGTASGRFGALRRLVTTGLTGEFELGEGMTVLPSARLVALWEDQQGWTDTLGTAHAARAFMSGTLSSGAMFQGVWRLTDDLMVLPYFGLYADYRFDSASGTMVQGFAGRTSAGLAFDAGGADIKVGTELGGFGSAQMSWGLNAGVSGGF